MTATTDVAVCIVATRNTLIAGGLFLKGRTIAIILSLGTATLSIVISYARVCIRFLIENGI